MKGKKTGGRQKGTPNQDTAAAQALADKLKINPFQILLYAAAGDWKALGYKDEQTVIGVSKSGQEIYGDRITVGDRISAAKEAVQYLLPKRKAIEATISNPDGSNIEPVRPMTPDELLAYVQVARAAK